MAKNGKYLVVYDISDDDERDKVSKVLEGYGFRVQESVFECVLSKSGREKLTRKLQELGLNSGFIYVYRAADDAKRVSIGKPPENDPDGGSCYVV